jgi:Ca-activated chloride channel family protein
MGNTLRIDQRRLLSLGAIALLAGLLGGCGISSDPGVSVSAGDGGGDGDADWDGSPPPSGELAMDEGEGGQAGGDGGGRTIDVGVGQGGAQDFGIFRRILEEGGLPLPETLDDVGFFAEHHTDLPPPDCGGALCLHGNLGVMGNLINGANCTMLQIGMNARVNEEDIRRLPLNLAVAIDTSGSMRAEGKIEFVRRGLELMVENLEPEDEITLITYSNEARIVAEQVGADGRAELLEIISSLGADGGTNLHDGLQLAFDQVRRRQSAETQNRVILLSDGQPTVGVTDTEEILEMARGYAEEGIGVTTIGVGSSFNPTLMRTISELGDGNFYFVENEAAVEEVFIEELSYFVTAIATDLRVELRSGGAYDVREVFGTKLWTTHDQGGAIEIPSVFVAHRQSHDDQESGRRGGGSAIMVEMLPRRDWREIDGIEPGIVGELTLSYLPAGSNIRESQTAIIEFPEEPGSTPEQGFFDGGATVEKGFIALNIYAGLRMASDRVALGDLSGAYSALLALEGGVAQWEGENHDEDIEDDLALIRQFQLNLLRAGAGEPDDTEPLPEPWQED